MNPRLTILAAALILAIAAAVYLRQTAVTIGPTAPPGTSTTPPAPAKTVRFDENRWARIYPDLDQAHLGIAADLHRQLYAWSENNPKVESIEEEFRKFALETTAGLKTQEIKSLISWMESLSPPFTTGPHIYGYLPALYTHWGTREPSEARDHALALLEKAPVGRRSVAHYGMRSHSAYGYVLTGMALNDPKSAWQTFLIDEADENDRDFHPAPDAIPGIFRAYAATNPKEAWATILHSPNDYYVMHMLKGYLQGIPDHQDWPALAEAITNAQQDRKWVFAEQSLRVIATRWLREDPVASLDWFGRHHDMARLAVKADDPFAPDPLFLPKAPGNPDRDPFSPAGDEQPAPMIVPPPEELVPLIQMEILTSLYRHSPMMVRDALQQLLSKGHDAMALPVIEHMINNQRDLECFHLLDLVPHIKDRTRRSEIFLNFVQTTKARGGPSDTYGKQLNYANVPYNMVREMAAQLDLPMDIRTEVDKHLQSILDQEEANRATHN